jgi:hypothetical protein
MESAFGKIPEKVKKLDLNLIKQQNNKMEQDDYAKENYVRGYFI